MTIIEISEYVRTAFLVFMALAGFLSVATIVVLLLLFIHFEIRHFKHGPIMVHPDFPKTEAERRADAARSRKEVSTHEQD